MKIFLVALLLVGCVSAPTRDIPSPIVEWAQENIWKVATPQGAGSGFWVDDDNFLTACHVVKGSDEIAIIRLTDSVFIPMDKISCNERVDVALLRVKWENPLPRGRGAPIGRAKMGQAVYGAGFPTGSDLSISSGHWNGRETIYSTERFPNGMYTATLPTINGDSGSPVLTFSHRKVQIVGIRLVIRRINVYAGFAAIGIPVPHIAGIGGSESLQTALRI